MGNANRSHTKDLILYIAIGVCIAMGVMFWPYLIPERYWPHLTTTWFAFIFFTAALGIFLVKLYWSKRKILKLWLLLGLLMAIHTTAYVILLSHLHQWPALWYLLTMPIEAMLFALVVKICLNILPTSRGRF
jgi:hypothetical protein